MQSFMFASAFLLASAVHSSDVRMLEVGPHPDREFHRVVGATAEFDECLGVEVFEMRVESLSTGEISSAYTRSPIGVGEVLFLSGETGGVLSYHAVGAGYFSPSPIIQSGDELCEVLDRHVDAFPVLELASQTFIAAPQDWMFEGGRSDEVQIYQIRSARYGGEITEEAVIDSRIRVFRLYPVD